MTPPLVLLGGEAVDLGAQALHLALQGRTVATRLTGLHPRGRRLAHECPHVEVVGLVGEGCRLLSGDPQVVAGRDEAPGHPGESPHHEPPTEGHRRSVGVGRV